MNKKYTIKNRSVDTSTLVKGKLHVVKSTEKGRLIAFLEPSCMSNKIDPVFVKKGGDWSKSLETWTNVFRLVSNTLELYDKASFESMMKEKAVMDSIQTIKTPRKANKEAISEDPPSTYNSFMSKREDKKPKTSGEYFDYIDQAFLQIYGEIKKVIQKT